MQLGQDIPYDASETTEFTPASLSDVSPCPIFLLGSPTPRQKRKARKQMQIQGVTIHTDDAIRAEILSALKQMWSEEDYAKHAPVLETYWEAIDDFNVQRRDEPDLQFEWPEDEHDAILTLLKELQDVHEPLREMAADNAEFHQVSTLTTISPAVRGWRGLTTRFAQCDGVASFDALEDVRAELFDLARKAGLNEAESSKPWLELLVACSGRQNLTEEKAGNSASPALSSTSQAHSKSPKASKTGTSPKSASSKRTPKAA